MKPNFLVVGAAKSGTTALYGLLKQHPQIFLPEEKECRYFSDISQKVLNPFTGKPHPVDVFSAPEDYYRLFNNAQSHAAVGDISPDYLFYHDKAIPRIKEELGTDVKIIIMLRSPVQRAFSNYLHLIRDNLTTDSFEDVIKQEPDWNDKSTWYGFRVVEGGMYYEAVKAYLNHFKDIKVIIFEDFVQNQALYLKEICDFLGVNTNFEFKKPEFQNKTGLPKRAWLHAIIGGDYWVKRQLKKLLYLFYDPQKIRQKAQKIKEHNLEKPVLEQHIRQHLTALYREDIENVEKLLNLELGEWK